MAVHFSGQHIYVQFIDDTKGVTLVAASTRRAKGDSSLPKLAANIAGATALGAEAARAARSKDIESVVFDRSGARYHGKLKALADAARSGGLKF